MVHPHEHPGTPLRDRFEALQRVYNETISKLIDVESQRDKALKRVGELESLPRPPLVAGAGKSRTTIRNLRKDRRQLRAQLQARADQVEELQQTLDEVCVALGSSTITPTDVVYRAKKVMARYVEVQKRNVILAEERDAALEKAKELEPRPLGEGDEYIAKETRNDIFLTHSGLPMQTLTPTHRVVRVPVIPGKQEDKTLKDCSERFQRERRFDSHTPKMAEELRQSSKGVPIVREVMTFKEYFNSLPELNQRQMLGSENWNLWKQGKITPFGSKLAGGFMFGGDPEPMPLVDLAEKHPSTQADRRPKGVASSLEMPQELSDRITLRILQKTLEDIASRRPVSPPKRDLQPQAVSGMAREDVALFKKAMQSFLDTWNKRGK